MIIHGWDPLSLCVPSLSCPRPPCSQTPLLSFYLPCTRSSLLTERKWKPPTFQDGVAPQQDVRVQRERPKGPRGQHSPRSQVYSRQYQGLGSGLEKSCCFEYVQVRFRLLSQSHFLSEVGVALIPLFLLTFSASKVQDLYQNFAFSCIPD